MIFLGFIILFLVLAVKNHTVKNSITKSPCKMHKWTYGEDGFLRCDVCFKAPGYEGRE